MDHGGQLAREDRVMSQVQMGEVDLCDNLPKSEDLTSQTRNLNETNTLSQRQNEEEGGLIQKANNNGKDVEEEQGKAACTERGREDEEEDIDEVMKDEEDEEESEESSCLMRCQSPDTPMTDSSYSETGSLLETPYPFSPGTSPEPTSPLVVSPETISGVDQGQDAIKGDSHNSESVASTTGSNTLAPTFTTGPINSTTPTLTSCTFPPGTTCITEAADRIAKNTDFPTEHLTSEPFTGTTCTTRNNTSIASTPLSSTTGPLTTRPTTAGTESTTTTGPLTSSWKHITSTPVPTCLSDSTCATGPILSSALLKSLEELAQRGDDTHLPQYLHQIAETFVFHKDYQRALWCIQLERLYHQRVLDNLNALQGQWESQCRSSSSDLETQHLDTLKNICQTHSRPGATDAGCPLRPTFEQSGVLPSSTSVHQVDEWMEPRGHDSSSPRSSPPVVPSINLTDHLDSPETSGREREDLNRKGCFHGDQLTVKQGSDGEVGEAEGGVEQTTSVIGNGLHPSTDGEMDQSKPAEQQGGDLGPAQEREAKKDEEESDLEKAAEVLAMEEEGEEEEEKERQKKRDAPWCQEALPVETLISGAEVELQQEAHAEEQLREETQESTQTGLPQEVRLPQGDRLEEQAEEEEEEEEEEYEEEEYEVEQIKIISEAASLDDMAKLITVQQASPASGLVSILKRRPVCLEDVSVIGSEPRPDKTPAKRRVRFKVSDDGCEQDVGGGDSCLLLFLLCFVTVVISVGGTALYCALGDAHSSVCQDFSRNADFYVAQLQSGISQIQHWLAPGS
ncbi:consortin isoform X1 [Pseudochaenichthys georgianus]|uniref:consortin isoform X1 n=2 Tax=Pseudochaenichthys georgianus TaxID=52239 RepID=UPI00146BAEF8|nr:consortin isoform X1 [Pseudochaenichthys georgianus]